MPISTPENLISEYRDSKEHFQHVLDCLILPSIAKAGFEAILPRAKGTDLIHAGIVNNLEIADLVLCDISTLNANVFFEFGIRTSLNKPVCIIKDNITKKVPFDTAILNYYEYDSSLEPWNLETEKENLFKHITDSYKRSNGSNDMWKYFGFKSEAVPTKGELSLREQYQYLSNTIENISMKLDKLDKVNKYHGLEISDNTNLYKLPKSRLSDLDLREIERFLKRRKYQGTTIIDLDATDDGDVLVFTEGESTKNTLEKIIADIKGFHPKVRSVYFVSEQKSLTG